MIGKEFDITTLDLPVKACANFVPVSLEDIIERYQRKSEMHLFIEQPHLDKDGKRVCNIYDCIYPLYLQHEGFVCEATSASKRVKKIFDEVILDGKNARREYVRRDMQRGSKFVSSMTWPVDALIHSCGLVRVFQYFHPSAGEVCDIQFPLKALYKKELQPEQYDVLQKLFKNNVIKDDHAIGHAEHVCARLQRECAEFVEDINSISR